MHKLSRGLQKRELTNPQFLSFLSFLPDSERVVVVGAEVAALSVGAEGVRPPQRPLDLPPHDEQLVLVGVILHGVFERLIAFTSRARA